MHSGDRAGVGGARSGPGDAGTAYADVGTGLSTLPRCWGEGLIFAFSGMDGPTDTASQFVATAAAERYSLLIHTPRRRLLHLTCDGADEAVTATGDVLVVTTGLEAALVAVYTAWHSLAGQVPALGHVSLCFEDGSGDRRTADTAAGTACTGSKIADEGVGEAVPALHVTVDADHGDAVVLARRGARWAMSYGASAEEATARAQAALDADLRQVIEDRLEIYHDGSGRPELEEGYARLFGKCLSVMRANTLAPEGVIHRHWSTPDRVPHRHMWLWDSVFHSFGMNLIDPALSWEFLQAVLEQQRDEDGPLQGMIPHCMQVDGTTSVITQPPILAWGIWENYRHLGDKDRLALALPRLEAYLTWNLQHRDTNGNGLLAWFIEETPLCRSGESGMDNSPRFDAALLLDAVDFSTFQALDMAATARIAGVLGDHAKAQMWQARADSIAQQIHALLWDPAQRFYCDLEPDGSLSPVKAVSGFLPLLLDTIPEDHVAGLVAHLENPATFGAAFPIPSLSLDHPAWSTDMWRGATWINYNYLVVLGLLRRRQFGVAEQLKTRWLAHVNAHYERSGVLFEFYDAKDEVLPEACDRKGPRRGPYDIRVKMDAIRDYHWTAALTACMLTKRDELKRDPLGCDAPSP